MSKKRGEKRPLRTLMAVCCGWDPHIAKLWNINTWWQTFADSINPEALAEEAGQQRDGNGAQVTDIG